MPTSTITADPRRQSAHEQWERTAEVCRQRLEANPQDAAALQRLAQLARETGQLDEAVELLFRSLQIDEENVEAISTLADVLQQLGRLDEALDFHRAALETAPRDTNLHLKLGDALAAAEHWAEARESFAHALLLSPRLAAAHAKIGWVQQIEGQLELALASYREARRLCPDSEQLMSNLGGCLVQAGRHQEAIEVLAQGVVKFPRNAEALSNLAAAYTALGRYDEATSAAWKAVELAPRSANALNNLGNALKAQGEFAQALNCFAKAREIAPENFIVYGNLGTTLSELGRAEEALQCLRRARALNPESATIYSNFLLTLNYLPGISREQLWTEHHGFDERFGQPLAAEISPHENDRDPRRRLRLGYVSADFRDHPVTNFVEPMLASHNAANFEIFCYANQRTNDAVTDRLRGYAHQWRDISGCTDAEMAAQIRRDRIDILVDLSGHTAGNRLLVFARKPAPVQVSMIGYMRATGLKAMDYRITDEGIDPTGTSEAFSSENLVRLTHGAATFRPPTNSPEIGPLPAFASGGVTFASFNNLAKVTPETVAVWARILHAVPRSRLLVIARAGHEIAEQFSEHGIDADRLEIIGRLPLSEYLALHNRADILLDTFPYNGGTTSLLAAWMGVPIVTLEGAETASRTGASLLRGLGLPELIATDIGGYLRCAINAAADLPRLAGWRASLRERLAPVIERGAGFTAEFEGELRKMWIAWCEDADRKN